MDATHCTVSPSGVYSRKKTLRQVKNLTLKGTKMLTFSPQSLPHVFDIVLVQTALLPPTPFLLLVYGFQ